MAEELIFIRSMKRFIERDETLSNRNREIIRLLAKIYPSGMSAGELSMHIGVSERTTLVELKYLNKLGFVNIKQ